MPRINKADNVTPPAKHYTSGMGTAAKKSTNWHGDRLDYTPYHERITAALHNYSKHFDFRDAKFFRTRQKSLFVLTRREGVRASQTRAAMSIEIAIVNNTQIITIAKDRAFV